jgi:hypothetical protein
MRRLSAETLFCTVTVLLAACGSRHADTRHSSDDGCHQFASCATCTPVVGCGWCYQSDGTGLCAAGPDECATSSFDWTWEATGCRVTSDAAVAPSSDAGSATLDAQACRIPPNATTAPARDAGSPGCMPAPAANLCPSRPSAQYELVCWQGEAIDASTPIPEPDPSLGCALQTMPTPPGELLYCCACAP